MMFSFASKLFSNVSEIWIVLNDAELKLSSFKVVFFGGSAFFFAELGFFCSSLSGRIPAISFLKFWDFCFAKSASFFLNTQKKYQWLINFTCLVFPKRSNKRNIPIPIVSSISLRMKRFHQYILFGFCWPIIYLS